MMGASCLICHLCLSVCTLCPSSEAQKTVSDSIKEKTLLRVHAHLMQVRQWQDVQKDSKGV